MKNRGFTLIELMILVSIIGILMALFINHKKPTTETYCISGYLYVANDNGNPEQVLDKNGIGVPCNNL